MKSLKQILSILALLICSYTMAQNDAINYKALIKDGGGNIVANQSITIQFQILQGGGMANVYQETHTPTTDANGIAIVNIGNGSVNSGFYTNIDWSSDNHFLNVQIDTGSGLTDMGTTEFMAVPYALSAQSIASETIAIDDLSDGKYDGSSLFIGKLSGLNDEGGNYNVALGRQALKDNTTGSDNTAIGTTALDGNTTGSQNTAVGYAALQNNTIGSFNQAIGFRSLINNTEGQSNIAIGYQSLRDNMIGNNNAAIGRDALFSNTIGNTNTAIGNSAMRFNTEGSNNIAQGTNALRNNVSGNNNTAIGYDAGYNVNGSDNVFLGHKSGYQELGSNKLYIENSTADADNALIYGEFDNDILRTNGTLQIGNPTATGFAFPTADGTANQILQTDGSGTLTWQDQVVGGATEIDELSDAKSDAFSVFIGDGSGFNDDGDNFNVAVGINSLFFNTSGSSNTVIGESALNKNTTGIGNTAIGTGSLYSNIDGDTNTAVGRSAGYSNTNGNGNIFLGNESGHNETGSNKLYIENSTADADNALIYGEFDNDILRTNGTLQIGNPTATGFAFPTADGTANQILQTDGNGTLTWQDASTEINGLNDATFDGSSYFFGATSGSQDDGTNTNIGIGNFSLNKNTSGSLNIGIGQQALFQNTTGIRNVGLGATALEKNTTGSSNIAIGYSGLYNNTIGQNNQAIGDVALFNNTEGGNNAAIGTQALFNNTTGFSNSAMGLYALSQNTEGNDNTAIGVSSMNTNTTGDSNTALGSNSGSNITTGNNNTALGTYAQVPNGTLDNQVRIGNTSVTYAGVQVAWTVTSDKRWKDNIRALPYGLNMVSQLQPVDYVRINNESKTREIGFIAQDVEKLLKELGYDDQGLLHKDDKGYMSLRYNDFIPVLVKAIQEQQQQIEALKTKNALLETETTEIETLKNEMAQIKAMLGLTNQPTSENSKTKK